MLDRDEKTVLACFPPDVPQEEMLEEADGRILVLMTLENSPAWIGGTYDGVKFHPPKENE